MKTKIMYVIGLFVAVILVSGCSGSGGLTGGATMEMKELVEVGDTVTVRAQGLESEKMVFTVGEGEVITGLEKAVIGMIEGQTKTTTIAAEDGYKIGPLAGKDLQAEITVLEIE